jgi:oligopeptide transport system permease protein
LENNERFDLILSGDSFEPLESGKTTAKAVPSSPRLSFTQDSWRRLKKNKGAVVSLCVLLFVASVAILAGWISPQNPNKQSLLYVNLPPKIPGVSLYGFNGWGIVSGERVDIYTAKNVPENVYFYLGTDALGRDELSRLLFGIRMSLIIAVLAAVIDLGIGVAYGLFSGVCGGVADTVMQRILEILSGIPTLVIMILMLTIFDPGLLSIVFAMIITGWVNMARVVRAQTLKIKEQEYVYAATVLGASSLNIALRHILPNIAGVIIVQLMFSIPTAIFFEAFLSFIGLGLKPPIASLGTLLNEGYKTFRFLPHLMWVPAAALSVMMICFNLLADGMRDAFDPKTKE